jgi:formylglycine-generating enzyme required for sulfatase activity
MLVAPPGAGRPGPFITIASGNDTPNPVPFLDYEVVQFKADRAGCRDTFRFPPLNKSQNEAVKIVGMPGVIKFRADGLSIDEAEIANVEWKQFELAQVAGGHARAEVAPDSAALPVADYYRSPFYAYYPVVGISHEQARQFCAWRSKVVNEQLARSKELAALVCEYRLPTETEWEEAAAVRSGLPFGTACTELPVRVAAKAAAYLQKRAGVATAIPQIKADIAAYNRQSPLRSIINYAQAEPYFLRLASPGYIYQGPPNYFGLYQMLGNAAEMVAEPGVSKGGSYRDELAACRIKARGHFDGPTATVGFRAVCTVRRQP